MQPPIFSYVMAPLILTLIKLLCNNSELYSNADRLSDRFRATYYDTEDMFDFIVVGAGSAGSVVANRLATNNFTVLLLEAGGEMQPSQYIPSTSLLLLGKPQLDWGHKTVPQTKSCFALNNQQSLWSQGKGLGGTGLLNFLQYLRGHRKDYEAWANITNDASWDYEGVWPYFKAIEDFKEEFGNQQVHGHLGEIVVQPPPYIAEITEYFLKAGKEKGFKAQDLNGNSNEGFSVIYNNIKNGRRLSPYNAFLQPIRDNPYLTISKFSEILIHEGSNEAYGVEYIRHGEVRRAFSKEVILSAGIVNSPKLLMLSGIGPRNHLESLGIETKYDSPAVGKNVQDHVSVHLGPFFVDKPITMLMDRDINSESFTDFMNFDKGPLTSPGTMGTALISSSYAKAAGEGDWPDLQFILLGTGVYSEFAEDFANAFNVKKNVLKSYLHHAKGRDSFQIIVSGNRPLQRGEILLSSKNPKDSPLIDPKYFHDERDVDVIVEGLKIALDLVENSTIFQEVGGRYTTERFPGCEAIEFRSDDYWRCLTKQYTISLHHLVGSCSMGRADSKEAVVDPQLKVIGVRNLRVIDASVMPISPNTNTNAAAMMIGQRGAIEILKFWKFDKDNNI